ncbi:MAG: hypothetical protein K2L07_05275 [Lachnospiraceae bacterium]|nr:hypothetical protein [Lachnospiraceae bacterium]
MLEQSFSIVKANWKHNLLSHTIVAVLLCVVSPLFMGVENLEEVQVAMILERYLCFLGVILIVPLFLPDTNKNIRDLIASKKMPITGIRCLRLLEAVVFVVILLLAHLLFLKQGNCQFRFGACFFAAFSTSLFLGGLGILFYSIIDNIALAYMMPFLYYMLSMGAGAKYLGKFWLFGFSVAAAEGKNALDKSYLLMAGIVMSVAAIWIREKRRD